MGIPEITLGGVSLLALIGIIVEVIKRLTLNTRLLPAISIILGMVLGFLAYLAGGIGLTSALVGGGLYGAAVAGVYDFGKKSLLNR